MSEKISSDYGNPIHGVSRQADTKKIDGQCREQINCRNNTTAGMESRAGFTCLGRLSPAITGNLQKAKWSVTERGDGLNFLVAYGLDSPSFFAIPESYEETIAEKPFTFGPTAESYYKSSLTDPKSQLGVSDILDTVFITNRTKIPTGDNVADVTTPPPRYQWIEFSTFSPGAEVQITVSGRTQYLYSVFDGFVTVNSSGVPDATQSNRTAEYSGSLHATYFASGSKPTYNDAGSSSPVLGVAHNNWVCIAGDFTLKVVQGAASVKVHDSAAITDIAKIPPISEEGVIVKITEGNGEDKNIGYFVSVYKDPSSTGAAEVYWEETFAPGSSGVFDKETMPFVIRRDISDNFTMVQYEWLDRQVGSEKTNPYPSFILNGTAIQDIGLFQNRLYLISQEIVLLSASDGFEDLWRSSSFYNTDADPIEVFADTPKLNIMTYSNLFDGDLVMFSPNGQFVMAGDITHTYESAAIMTQGQYESDLLADPVVTGDQIFFATTYGAAAGVRDFYTDGTTAIKRSRSITDHVNDYIPGRIRHLVTSTNIDSLIALNTSNLDTCWLYEWKYNGNEKVQSAWSKWKLPNPEGLSLKIETMEFIDSELIMVVKQNDGTDDSWWLWRLQWDDPVIEGLEFPVRLDGKFFLTPEVGSYDSALNRTSLGVLPYFSPDMIAVEIDSDDAGFSNAVYKDTEGNHYINNHNLESVKLVLGLPYRQYWEAMLPQVKDRSGVPYGTQNLRYMSFDMLFQRIGEMNFIVSDIYNREWVNTYINRRVNNPSNIPSNVPYGRDSWTVPIKRPAGGLTLALETYSYIPFSLSSVEWVAKFNPRSKRL